MARILTIVGSPRPDSFAHALANEVSHALAGNTGTIDFHDLYEERFAPVAPPEEASTVGMEVEDAIAASTDSVVRAHRRSLTEADMLVVAHPNW